LTSRPNEAERGKSVGVHNKAVYGKIKQELGIPPEEPIFIFRAQDVYAPVVLEMYRNIIGYRYRERQEDFLANIEACVREFHHFQAMHKDRVKEPD
jgi:hypothetical protein